MNKSEKLWDKISKNYDKGSDKQFNIKVVENTKKHLDISDIVLDYACGIGTLTIETRENKLIVENQ